MDDQVVFLAFLVIHCGIAEGRHLTELVIFVDTFRGLLGTSDDEIDEFMKDTNSNNNTGVTNQRIPIPIGTIIK